MSMRGLQLAAIGNCAVASLITRDGRNVWFGFPRLDSDPVFSALLDGDEPERGFMDVQLRKATHWRQSYVRNTAVLETVGTDADGDQIRITDFAPRFERFGRSFRPPQLVRRLEPLSGQPHVRVRIRPRFDYGQTAPAITMGSNHVRYSGPAATLRLTCDMPTSYVIEESEFVLDRAVNLFLGADESVPDNPDGMALRFLKETTAYWQDWARGLSVPFEWQDEVIRSAITLKLCSYEDTGAIVAALTTSIPEAEGSTRTWDYRFCWLRDAFFTVGALNRLGATRTMEGFIRFVINAVLGNEGPAIAPLYPISGGREIAERHADVLKGFLGFKPVRIGNAAATQTQNDAYGSIVLTAAQMFWDRRLPNTDVAGLYRRLRRVGQLALQHAFDADSGPWEYRGRVAPHTFSAAMCWAAVHRLGMIAGALGKTEDALEWTAYAKDLRAKVLARATTRDGWISGVLDGEVVDATTLLLPEIGLLDATDRRMHATLDVIAQRLVRDGFVMRYDEADDFGRPETAFLVCTFWYCDALALGGRRQEARELFANAMTCANHVGLLSEDYDLRTKTLWGNFPQAYSHVGLIHSASRLSRGWEEALWRAS